MRQLLPPPPRLFPGQRWVNIALRCLHLVTIAGVAGGFLFALPETEWRTYWNLALISGVLLALLYVWTDAAWLLQVKGQAVVLKIGLLALAAILPAWRAEAFVLVIIVSGLSAHAPARVRNFAIIGGRAAETASRR